MEEEKQKVDNNENPPKNTKGSSKILVLLITLIVICLVGYVVYAKFLKEEPKVPTDNNNTQEGGNSNEVVETNDVISFAKKDQKLLVSFTSNGSETLIYDFNNELKYNDEVISLKNGYGEFHYDYDKDENTIYVFLVDESNKKYLISINLSDESNTPKVIAKLDKEISGNHAYYVAKIGKSIYLSYMELYRYDIDNNQVFKMNIASNNRIMWALKNNSNLIYNIDQDIYMMDSNNQSTLIIPNSRQAFVYNNKLIYFYEGEGHGTVGINQDADNKYYVYDFTNSNKTLITKFVGVQSSGKEYVVPFNDGLYSFEGRNLNKYSNSIELVHTFTCDDFDGVIDDCTEIKLNNINEIVKISDSKMLMIFGNEYEGELFSVIYDLKNQKVIKDGTHTAYQYLEEYYVEK